jgi:acylglycerol lipase
MRFHKVAHALTAHKYAVFGLDYVGHGASSGHRALVTDYKVLIDDFVAFGTYVHSLHPGLPIFVIGQGLGGLVAILSAEAIQNIAAVWQPFLYFLE